MWCVCVRAFVHTIVILHNNYYPVPSERKRDVRSIEETMIALRAKKKKENEGRISSQSEEGEKV